MIAVCDYGIGNLRSAEKALQHLGAPARLVSDPEEVAAAEAVVLPGVGSFGPCAAALRSSGLQTAVLRAVERGTPFLGICIGFQLLFERSEESGDEAGLGIFEGSVVSLPAGVKRPQMQWNEIRPLRPSSMFDGLGDSPWVYFVHSYAPEPSDATVAVCDYGGPVVAAAERDNVWGVQFHPEKSGPVGLGILANFVRRTVGDGMDDGMDDGMGGLGSAPRAAPRSA